MRYLLISLFMASFCACASMRTAAGAKTHREAVETLLDMFEMETMLQASVKQMVALQVQQNPQLGLYQDELNTFFAKYMNWNAMKNDFVAIYMEEFSEGEIRELIAFYNTPTGKKAIEKMPVLMARGSDIGTRRVRENIPELTRMLQEETERLHKLQGKETSSL